MLALLATLLIAAIERIAQVLLLLLVGLVVVTVAAFAHAFMFPLAANEALAEERF